MRKDMGKIITERPRRGSGLPNAKYGKSVRWDGADGNYDSEPKRQSSGAIRQYGWEARSFTDVLGPIKGWLYKQVNRPWNKIFSELNETLDRRKLTHNHVFDHIWGWVEKEVYFDDKDKQWHSTVYGAVVKGLFIHPRTGILKKQIPKEDKEKKPVTDVRFNETQWFIKHGDVWFLCTFEILDAMAVHHIDKRWIGDRMVEHRVTNYDHFRVDWRYSNFPSNILELKTFGSPKADLVPGDRNHIRKLISKKSASKKELKCLSQILKK